MCLFSSRPKWEEDIIYNSRPRSRRHSHIISETIIQTKTRPSVEHVSAPSLPPATPPPPPKSETVSLAPSPPPERLELVSVEEDRSSRSGSRSGTKKSRRRSGGEEVYIERERIRERMKPPQVQNNNRVKEEYDTYRYVEAPVRERVEAKRITEREREHVREVDRDVGRGSFDGRASFDGSARMNGRRTSITYESNPRLSARVVVEDQGRRREYYRRP